MECDICGSEEDVLDRVRTFSESKTSEPLGVNTLGVRQVAEGGGQPS